MYERLVSIPSQKLRSKHGRNFCKENANRGDLRTCNLETGGFGESITEREQVQGSTSAMRDGECAGKGDGGGDGGETSFTRPIVGHRVNEFLTMQITNVFWC